MPAVSVIIPTFNRAAMVRRAIESVRAQTFTDWELLVVDDGSTDGTEAIARSFQSEGLPLIYLQQAGQGQFAALNAGLSKASGTYVAFLDDDDWWLPEKLATQMALLKEQPSLGFVYCAMRIYTDGHEIGKLKPEWPGEDTYEGLLQHNFIPMATLVRRSCIDEVGGFDPMLGLAGDYDLWLRIGLRHFFRSTQEPLAIVRQHGGNKSADRGPRLYQAHVRIFEKLLANPALRPLHRALAVRRLAKEWYLLGRAHRALGHNREAAAAFARGLRLDAAVGAAFIAPGDSWSSRAWKVVKPYVVVSYSGLAGLGANQPARSREAVSPGALAEENPGGR